MTHVHTEVWSLNIESSQYTHPFMQSVEIKDPFPTIPKAANFGPDTSL
jgi:hypothetical protein